MSLRANVLAAIITATAALVLALILLEGPLVEYRQTAHARVKLLETANRVVDALERGEPVDRVADRVGAESAARVEVFRRSDGVVIGDTATNALGEIVPRDDPEIERALAEGGEGWAVRPNPGGASSLFVVRLHEDAVIRVARPLATIEAARESIRELILAGGLISILASALLTYVITRTMVGPIERLTRTADALARGDLSARARIGDDRKDEIARLGSALDSMAARLETQLEEARAGEERLRTMLDSMVEAVFVTDRTGRIRITNRALEAMVATPANGRKVKEVIRNEHLRDAIRKSRRGEEAAVEFAVVLQGRERSLQAHVTPLLEEIGVVAVLHDVTDLKRADRIRRDFVANASHELRTPLTAIRGFAETLRDNPDTPGDTSDRFLDAILRHTHRLQRLVDDLLALSRAESEDQKFELGSVEVGPIVRDVASGLEAKGGQKGIQVSVEGVDELPRARANAWALDHVVVNLIDNAVKYTPEGGKVYVRGMVQDGEAGRGVLLEVTDTGPGIAAEQRQRIFERFFRVDAGRTRTQGGTGLGLSIVKHLVSRMGGKIDVESELGAGTTFRLLLPLNDGPALPGASEEGTELLLPPGDVDEGPAQQL